MRLKAIIAIVTMILVAGMFVLVVADEAKKAETKHAYIGANKCKMCHKKDGIFDSWSATAHATVYDKLSEADKAKDELKKYYTTGTDDKGVLLEGVQCEACHGAGADYKKKSIMEDREQAIANGLIIPDEKTCKCCHNEKAPGKLAESAKAFDFAKMKAKGVHAPAATEKK
ncbi:MAG: multiheme c-type cytochrome [Candidatus Zixiibacteriota bacterium]